MPSTSSSESGRRTLPGLPMTSDRGGISIRSGISAPAAMIESDLIVAPLSRIAPIPTSTRSSIVQPWSTAAWPTVTSSPMRVGCVPRMTCTIVPSWIFVRRPIRIS